ncbi:MAG: porin family protein, partial [Pseudomonadales bacterium]|nr:porin family protein [Pseudomonadales bacterium]
VAEPEKGIYVFPQAAIADYSNISELEADPLIGVGVGYRFMGPFAVELDYLTGDSNIETADVGSADVEIWKSGISVRCFTSSSQTDCTPSPALAWVYRTSIYPMSAPNPKLTQAWVCVGISLVTLMRGHPSISTMVRNSETLSGL